MSDATDIGAELLELARGVIPTTARWRQEIYLDRNGLPASKNKPLACNAAELVFARLKNQSAKVRDILDWWVWLSGQPFTEGEDLTPEEVYRGLMAHSGYAAGVVARVSGHPGAGAIREYVRSHIAWLAIAAGAGPGRSVRDHQLAKIGQPVVLTGDGPNACDLPYVAQAGKRGWVRGRAAEGDGPTFHFADRVGLSVMLAQAAGLPVKRKLAPWQVDLVAALQALNPVLGTWLLTEGEQQVLRAFLSNPTDSTLAREISTWLRGPSLPVTVARHADGSVWMLLRRAGGSSTATCMIDVWHAGGRTVKTSADDGSRSAVHSQVGVELEDRLTCQREDGGPLMSVPKPAAPEVWRVTSDLGFVRFLVAGGAAPVATPVNPQVNTGLPTAPRKRSKGCLILLAPVLVALVAWACR